jgi:hypothetical protein
MATDTTLTFVKHINIPGMLGVFKLKEARRIHAFSDTHAMKCLETKRIRRVKPEKGSRLKPDTL